jgi:pectate lyase
MAACAALFGCIVMIHAQQLAFPGAEGYGKYTKGGRGGKVYEVTNLDNSGSGSLRAAVEASGPRTVVFRVSGTIILSSGLNISNPYITIAGQTAPGDGICIRKNPVGISADEVIIRYIRVRLGDEMKNDADAIGGRYHKNIIVDHVSATWGDDEVLSVYHCENVTIQWCLVAEALNRGGSHAFAGIWGSQYSTYHHNLLAHCVSRNPRWASGCGYNDHRNNVIYNWGYNSCYGGEAHQSGDRRNPPIEFSTINMVANFYKPGPGTESGVRSRIADPSTRNGDADAGKWWVSDNFVDGSPEVTADNWKGVTKTSSAFRLDKAWDAMPINQQTAKDAYASVLEHVGASLPKRDAVDERIIQEVQSGTATKGKNGIIESQSEVGGWPELKSTTAPADSDHDGMPDEWEKANSLNPDNADDRNTVAGDGYTMLEKYLNSLVEKQTTAARPKNIADAPSADKTVKISQSASGRAINFSCQPGSHGLVTLKLYDVAGREAASVIRETGQAGKHTHAFDISGLSKGAWLAKLTVMPHDGPGAVVRTAKVLISE